MAVKKAKVSHGKLVCKTSDIPKGTMKGFTVNDKQILIASVEGNFYAMDAVCSHMGGYLPMGELKGNLVICPVHNTNFDVTTGKVVKNVSKVIKLLTGKEASDLKTYKLTVKDGSIYLNE